MLHYRIQMIHHKQRILGYIDHRHSPIILALHMKAHHHHHHHHHRHQQQAHNHHHQIQTLHNLGKIQIDHHHSNRHQGMNKPFQLQHTHRYNHKYLLSDSIHLSTNLYHQRYIPIQKDHHRHRRKVHTHLHIHNSLDLHLRH